MIFVQNVIQVKYFFKKKNWHNDLLKDGIRFFGFVPENWLINF